MRNLDSGSQCLLSQIYWLRFLYKSYHMGTYRALWWKLKNLTANFENSKSFQQKWLWKTLFRMADRGRSFPSMTKSAHFDSWLKSMLLEAFKNQFCNFDFFKQTKSSLKNGSKSLVDSENTNCESLGGLILEDCWRKWSAPLFFIVLNDFVSSVILSLTTVFHVAIGELQISDHFSHSLSEPILTQNPVL